MKTNLLLVTVLVILLAVTQSFPQDLVTTGRFTNSVYAFEPPILRGSEESETHVLLFQYFRFKASMKEYNNLTFNLDTRFLTDLQEDIDNDLRFRVNRISLSADDLFNGFMDVEVGRLFFHPGITFGSMDGVNLNLKPLKNLHVELYAGVESYMYRSYKMYNFSDATVYGGSLKYFNFYRTNLDVSYLQKTYDSEIQWQLAGVSLANYSFRDWKFLLQTHYDIANSRLHRFFFSTRFTPTKQLHFNVNLKQQHPQVYADSYFQMFDLKEYRKAGVGASYYFTNEYALNIDYDLFQIEDGQGNRVILSLNNNHGSIGVVYETGDLGDQIGFMADYGYEFLPGLVGSIYIDYLRYRFEEIYSYENQLTNAVRVAYDISRNWKVDLEYQFLNDKFKTSDHRLLNHIHFIW